MATAEALSAPMDLTEARALAELLQTLGDPTRLRILSALDTACVPVGAIVEATGLRQPTVSHHLRILRDRGLVRAERRGTFIYYCADSETLRPALDAACALLDARSAQRARTSAIAAPAAQPGAASLLSSPDSEAHNHMNMIDQEETR